jgi:hypothetical protein
VSDISRRTLLHRVSFCGLFSGFFIGFLGCIVPNGEMKVLIMNGVIIRMTSGRNLLEEVVSAFMRTKNCVNVG